MIANSAFRSTAAGDLLRYIALQQAWGRCFARTSIILLKLDQFLCGPGMPSTDLTRQTFQPWSQSLEPLSATTRLARMQTVRNFCIDRRRIGPDCFVPIQPRFRKRALSSGRISSPRPKGRDFSVTAMYCRKIPRDLHGGGRVRVWPWYSSTPRAFAVESSSGSSYGTTIRALKRC